MCAAKLTFSDDNGLVIVCVYMPCDSMSMSVVNPEYEDVLNEIEVPTCHSNVIRRKPRNWITSSKEITKVFLFPGIMLNQRKSIRMLVLVSCTIRASIISLLPQKCMLSLRGIA